MLEEILTIFFSFLIIFLRKKGLLIKLDFINESELYFPICFLFMIA